MYNKFFQLVIAHFKGNETLAIIVIMHVFPDVLP